MCEKSELEEQLRSKASELNRLEEANQLLRAQVSKQMEMLLFQFPLYTAVATFLTNAK